MSTTEHRCQDTDRYRSLFLGSHVAIYEVGPEGRILEANPATAALTGRSLEELKGCRVDALVVPEHRGRAEELLRRTLAGERLTFEAEIDTPHRGRRTIAGISIPLEVDGVIESAFATAQDVTEQVAHRARVELQADLLDAVQQAVIATDAEGRITYWNRHAEELYGWSAEEILGEPVTTLVPPARQAEAEAVLGRVASTGEAWMGDFEVQRKDGSTFTALIQDSPLRDPDGEVRGYVGTSVDVTRQREHDRLRRHHQKMAELGRLAGGVAHDFNNLLTAIHGNASLLLDEPGLRHREELREIWKTAQRGASLTRRLLAYSRRDEDWEAQAPTDMARVVMDAGELLNRLLGEHIDLEYRLASGLRVLGSAHQLEQVVVNLAVNARDAMEGGGVLRIALEAREVAEGTRDGATAIPAGRYAVLSVRDTGVGMDQATLDLIFEPFFSTKSEGRGTGLGLSNALSVVESHRGHVAVESRPGEGSEFRIYLPLLSGASTKPTYEVGDGPSEPAWESLQTLETLDSAPSVVLVVDDEASLRRVACRILEREGYGTRGAATATEALDVLQEEDGRVSVALVDLGLPDLPGERLRTRLAEVAPRLPVVLTSGRSRRDLEEVVDGLPRTTVLPKPFTPAELLEAVDAARGTDRSTDRGAMPARSASLDPAAD